MHVAPSASSQIPHGVGLPPPPGMDPRQGKLMCIKVRMLDDTTAVFHLGHKATGQALFDEVCRHLNLLESDYFGLEFVDVYNNRVWLEKEKSILRQITSTQSDARFFFIVKFYTPNPADLEEEYTRYLISLQIRRDLAQGEFVCNENSAALLVAYIVQADCGDFSADDYPDHTYLSPISFVPNQTVAFQIKVMENHKQLIGMTPGEADLSLLEVARRCDFYGIKLHVAKDIEGTDVNLSVAHMGVKVFHNLQCVSVFSWAKVRKLSFKRKKLMIKLHPESNPYYKETVEFAFDTRNECKNFWKKCVEHHAFFRCNEITEPKKEHKFFSRGSSFRYHGRTQKQLIDYVREHHKRREPFSRPIRSSNSRSGSAQRHIQFNVIDATTGSLTRRSQTASSTDEEKNRVVTSNGNGNGHAQQFGPVYYPPGYGQPRSQPRQQRPKSAYQQTNYGSDNERNCVSDLETTNKEYYIQQKSFKDQPKQEAIDEGVQTTSFVDPMSQSLPNVLGDDIKIICREFELQMSSNPPKSASGDNFLEQVNNPNAQFDYYLDNLSDCEGSYKLPEHQSSSQSDVGSTATDPRVFNTTFTTKRVGNVIVKKVTAAQKQRHKSDNDEDESGYLDHAKGARQVPYSKYAQVMRQSMAAGGMSRFRDAVPIPIDGPGAAPSTSTATAASQTAGGAATTAIIKPVVLSPMQNRSFFDQEKRAKIQQIPLVAAAGTSYPQPQQQSSASPEEPKYSAVHRIRQIPPRQAAGTNLSTFSPSPSTDTGFKSIAASASGDMTPSEGPERRKESSEKEGSEGRGVAATYGATGPLKGKVIHKENLVITPEGITVREALVIKERPAVPPKPKYISSSQPSSQNPARSPPPPVPAKPKAIPAADSLDRGFEKLLEPLDSILKDAEELSVLSQGRRLGGGRERTPETAEPVSSQRDKITVISVESADRPDVKKVHLLNGEIPYTLTMRNLDSGVQPHPSLPTFSHSQGIFEPRPGDDSRHNVDISKHRKTVDLVQRRRLPSQDSFSSQDHSISPTTPDTGNVVDYVMRKRSLSSDRYPTSKNRGKRGDPRRQTQPVVRFSEQPITSAAAFSAAPVVKPESDEDNELPDPPPALSPVPPTTSDREQEAVVKFADESTSKDTSSDEKLDEPVSTSEPSTSRTDTGLLWTDF